VKNEEWRYDANCADKDREMFFSADLLLIEKAKSVCLSCSVREECLTWGIETNNEGITGGLTQRERRKYVRMRRFANIEARREDQG
jgi:WhiB family redox-sensing transcriptional regulator